MNRIRFGTEGWRALLAEDYTFGNVRVVARATGRWFRQQPSQSPVAIGHDTRFLGDRFAGAVANELAECGVATRLAAHYAPTPAVCYYTITNKLAGAVVLTASHNPAEWNGFKVKNSEGASLPTAHAKWIGEEANRILEEEPADPAPPREHERFDVRDAYLDHILSLVDREAIGRAKLTVVADLMHGAGIGYFDEALRRAGCAAIRALRTDPDPTFDGQHPEPIGPNLEPSIPLTADPDVNIGLATDGDGDRLGMMAHGEYIDIQRAIVFILYHLLKNRGWRGRVVRSLNVTSMVDRLCDHYGCTVTETSVGFKNIGPDMAKSDDIILGVEESGGFGIKGHIPDRDGSLAALTACEALAYEGKPVRDILADVFSLVGGRMYFGRIDRPLEPRQSDEIRKALPSLEPDAIAGVPVERVNQLDGAKCIRKDGSWVLLRLSGTEPLLRMYAEARSENDLQGLLEAGRDMALDLSGG